MPLYSKRTFNIFSIGRVLLTLTIGWSFVQAFDLECNSNLATYWGQNVAGVGSAPPQKNLSSYCQDDTVDVIPLAFLWKFFGADGYPRLDLSNICSDFFPNTMLLDCPSVGADIKYCQSQGKLVTLSLGGATFNETIASETQATQFADQIWGLFLGGNSAVRPFGDAVLDGIDVDIEIPIGNHFTSVVSQLISHFASSKKKSYLTAAPQCSLPDVNVGPVLNASIFDAVYVQFYNNPCGVSHFGDADSAFNFADWDHWARTTSPNKDIKVYMGAVAATYAGINGTYVDSGTLASVIKSLKQYKSFGGVMLWDVSAAAANDNYHVAAKSALKDISTCSAANNTASVPVSSTPCAGKKRAVHETETVYVVQTEIAPSARTRPGRHREGHDARPHGPKRFLDQGGF